MTPDAIDLCVFAIKRGQIKNRYDVQNALYILLENDKAIQKIPLGDLVKEEPCYGTSATAVDRISEDQPKYIRITDFDDFGIEDNHTFMTAETYAEKHLLEDGDVLFARTGGTVGKTYYYDGSIGKAVFAGYCIRFRFDAKKVLPKFVYWCTKTASYAAWVKGIQRPSGQPNINKEEFKSYRIAMPDKEKQLALITAMNLSELKRARSLQKANKKIKLAREHLFEKAGIAFPKYHSSLYSCSRLGQIKEIGLYCNPRSAYLNEVFSKLYNSPYHSGTLEDYVDVNPTINRVLLNDSSDVSFVPMPAVSEKTNQVVYEQKQYKDVKTGFTPFQRGDLLWAKITPCMQNGKSFISDCMPTEYGFGSTEFHVLRQKSERIYMPFLWVLLSDEHILEAAQGMFSGSAGQQRVPDTFLKKMPIILPPIKVQRALAAEVLEALSQAKKMKDAAELEWMDSKAQFEKELLGEK